MSTDLHNPTKVRGRMEVIRWLAETLDVDAMRVSKALNNLVNRGLVEIGQYGGPECGCAINAVEKVRAGGTCGRGGCPYGGDL